MSSNRFSNKVALITGGSKGIGRNTAECFAREGAKVILIAPDQQELQECMPSGGGQQGQQHQYHCIVGDVSKENDCQRIVQEVIQKYQKIDILFNNAGLEFHGKQLHETETHMWDQLFNVNVRGAFLMSKYVIPHMIKQGGGNIVNNSSVAGLKAVAMETAYSASKAALNQLTRGMAQEYASKNIRVNAVCPGTIDTPWVQQEMKSAEGGKFLQNMVQMQPIKHMGKPEDVAQAVMFLCADSSRFITGDLLSVDGGYAAA